MDIFSLLNQQLVKLLTTKLPALKSDWWKSLVLDKLTYQQKTFAVSLPPQALERLDLAALLRIADQNWYDIANQGGFNREARNWLKEAQTIRNRWAHAPAEGLPDDMCYRDVDTIERLLQVFGADSQTLNRVKQEKQHLLNRLANHKKAPVEPPLEPISISCSYKPGDMVRLKAEPSKTGAITAVLNGDVENRYQVFLDAAISTFYESQIEPITLATTRTSVTPDELHAAMTALQLRHPSTRHLYSLFASRISFIPYQFRPVLKLIQADRPRILIADEVGVGKTIEAGLILKELQARRELKTVLVICPKPLVAERKWLNEMKRFDERFEHLDGQTLRYCLDETDLDGVWPQNYARAILPYSLLDESLLNGKQNGRKKQKGLIDLDPPPIFDLVIVDEAHAIRNTNTWAHQNVRYFCDNAEAVVLLSATPIQLGNQDLFNLLQLLRPDVITRRGDFDAMAEPNPALNKAIEAARAAKPDWKERAFDHLHEALATAWGLGVLSNDPKTQQILDLLLGEDDSTEVRLTIVRLLETLYTFAPFINRTRRRDIGNFTTRKPETISVEFTPEQAELHRDLLDLLARILQLTHGNQNLKFLLSTIRRQIASSVFGLAPLLKDILHRHLSKLEIDDIDPYDSMDTESISQIIMQFRQEVDELIQKAQRVANGPDPKLAAFLKVIRDKQALDNNKLLVFSCFRHTWEYLEQALKREGVRVGLIHGKIADDQRRELRNRFSLPKDHAETLDVLLSSEVGCEGLDYQFCDGMVNYDLPWNPMRVEQRIGRIDRYGQKSPTVVIYNFITPGTVDAEIYDRCLWRIGVFQQSIGGNEEILGELTQEIQNIADDFNLTPEQQAARLQQLSDNDVRIMQEQAQLEQQQSQLFGLTQPKQDQDLVNQASSFWLSQTMLANLIGRYLQQQGANIPASLGQKAVTTLQLGQDLRDCLLKQFQSLKFSGESAQQWQRWLKGNDPYLKITFDQETASDNREILFIAPTHPLAQQAAFAVEPVTPMQCNLVTQTYAIQPGYYPYAIYRWQKKGIKEDFTFQPLSTDPRLTEAMLSILEFAQPFDNADVGISAQDETELEQHHHRLWLDARAEHIEQVRQQVDSRLNSLKTTHSARIAGLKDQLETNSNAKIQRMKQAQIETAERDFAQHLEQLELAAKQADILTEAVVFGILVIEGKQ
ncbi:DEAD/DEAH box helicase [Methylomonas rapida]|uniref:DEAD/DEAH box helicase n=1 Tax=Methylomonas rapida TaxID=2963939 RepID=UPI0020CE9EF4